MNEIYVGPCKIDCKRKCEIPEGETLRRVPYTTEGAMQCAFSMVGDADCSVALIEEKLK